METFVFHQWPKNSNRMIDEYHKRHEIVFNQVRYVYVYEKYGGNISLKD